jgi:hypothetical protein
MSASESDRPMMALLLFLMMLGRPDRPGPLDSIGRLEHRPIREASGIVASRRHPGVFWVHNDSGNAPVLYAVRRDGTLLAEYAVNAPNIDWEDIATDDDGHLFIGEIGNNGRRLPIRAIYRLDEPDPARPPEGKLAVTLASYYRFAPDGGFDAEGLFIDRGRAVVVAKTFDEREAELFAVPLDPPAPLLRPALPDRLGTLPAFVEPATGADLSPEGLRLAVCSYDVVRVYGRAARDSDRWSLSGTVRFEADGVEAVAWAGDDLILAGEGRGLYRIAAKAWRTGTPAFTVPDH